jgi:hypothetical protein
MHSTKQQEVQDTDEGGLPHWHVCTCGWAGVEQGNDVALQLSINRSPVFHARMGMPPLPPEM